MIGYVGKDNRTILDVPACPLAKDGLNTLLSDIRDKGDWNDGGKKVNGRSTRKIGGIKSWQNPTKPNKN